MKIFNKIFNCIMVIAITISNFSFLPTVFALDNNTNGYANGEVVDGFKEVGSTTNEGDVYLSKEVEATDEDGIYQVTLKTKGKNIVTTESQEVPIYTVVVFDKSGSMENDYCNLLSAIFNGCSWGQYIYKWDNAVEGAKEFASSLIQTYSKAEIALVTFDTDAHSTPFANQNLDSANFGSPSGNTSLGKALKEANNLLDNAPQTANKYIVVISDGEPTDGNAYVAQANYAHQKGYEIFAIGYEDEGTALKNMVSEPKDKHYSDGNAFNIKDVFSDIVDNIEVVSPAGTNAKIKDVIGDEFEYVLGSATLNGVAIEPTTSGKSESFSIGNIEETEKTVSFKIRIKDDLEPGLYDTNGSASVEYDGGEKVITESPKVNINGYTYKVNYIDQETKQPVAKQEVVENKLYNHTYTEESKNVTGYNVDSNTKDITITEDNQEITFYYTKKTNLSYTVKYYNDNLDNLINSHTFNNQTFEQKINASDINVNEFKQFGYQDGVIKTDMPYTIIDGINVIQVLYNKRNDLKYNVEYRDSDTKESIIPSVTREGKTYLETYTETAEEAPFGYELDGESSQDVLMNADDKTVTFYYKKRTNFKYTVKYIDAETKEELHKKKTVENVEYKKEVEESAEVISGYIVDADSKKITITEEDMEIVFEYTKKTNLSYTVKYYNDNLDNLINSHTFNNQTFEQKINASDINVNEFKQFGYQDGVIKTDMPYTIIDGINVIQVLYNKRNDLKYNVEYRDSDTKESIIPSVTREGKTYLETYTETAEEAPFGYELDGESSQDVLMNADDKTVTFYYKKRTNFKYTVKYIDAETKEELHKKKTVENVEYKKEVEESAEVISGYIVDADSKKITITEEDMEIVFEYTKKTNLSYTVKYYNDNLDNLINSHTFNNQTFEQKINASDINVNEFKQFGYQDGVIKTDMPYTIIDGINVIQVLYNKRNDLKYNVEYRDSDTKESIIPSVTREGKTYLETYTETAEEAPFGYELDGESSQDVLMNADDKTVTFYYKKRTNFKYTVKYIDAETKEELHKKKTVENVEYKKEVEESAEVISGYIVDADSKKITITEEDMEIVFEYTKKTNLSYTVNYYTKGDEDKFIGYKTTTNMTFETVINEDDIDINFKRPQGYKDGVIDTDMPYTIIDGENIIDVYYSIKDDLTYRVEYYIDGVIDSSKTDYFENIVYGTVIDKYTDKLPAGYKFDSDTGKLMVTDDKDNVIKVYYSKVEEEVAPNTGLNGNNYLLLILGILPIGILSSKRKLKYLLNK